MNELSAALKRRFNYIHIPIVGDQKTEVEIVQQRSSELLARYQLPTKLPPSIIQLLATVFREIRNGRTHDGVSIKQPSNALSTAEAIGVARGGQGVAVDGGEGGSVRGQQLGTQRQE